MAKKKAKKKIKPSAYMQSAAEKEAKPPKKRPSNRALVLTAIISAAVLAVAALTTLLIILLGGDKAEKLNAKASEYLKNNPYTVVISSSMSSMDSEINSELGGENASVSLTVDGESFSFTEARGQKNITYLFVDDVFYVNESFIGIITKESMKVDRADFDDDASYNEAKYKRDSEKAALYDKYVTPYLDEVSFSDYEGYELTKNSDGSITLTYGPMTEAVAKEFESSLAGNVELAGSVSNSYIDRELSTLTVKIDKDGRYTDISAVYALAVVYSDGYRALVNMTSQREYSYTNSQLATPSDAAGYIDMDSTFEGLFTKPFKVTTDIITSTGISASVRNKLQDALGYHSIVRVDGDNYEITWPSTAEAGAAYTLEIVNTLFNKVLYMKETETYLGETGVQLTKGALTDDGINYYYKNAVMKNFVPTYARGFRDISVTKNDDGSYTVECVGLTEDYYNELYKLVNRAYKQGDTLLVPDSDNCYYIVTTDENGRYLKSEFGLFVLELTDAQSQIIVSQNDFIVKRTFDYTEAESFYESAAEGESWVKAPENADDYEEYFAE